MKKIEGQLTIEEYQKSRKKNTNGCQCICKNCLYWWSSRCPYGKCYDDYRAETEPYDKEHPGRPPRKQWSNWNKPGEQAHWCRGGIFYTAYYCEHFVKYKGQQVRECIKANVSVFQDGHISCNMIDCYGCERCYAELEEKMEREEESEN